MSVPDFWNGRNYKMVVPSVFIGLTVFLFMYKLIFKLYGYESNSISVEIFIVLLCLTFITGEATLFIIINYISKCIKKHKLKQRQIKDKQDKISSNKKAREDFKKEMDSMLQSTMNQRNKEKLKEILRWFDAQSEEYKNNLLKLQKLNHYIDLNHRKINFDTESDNNIRKIFEFFIMQHYPVEYLIRRHIENTKTVIIEIEPLLEVHLEEINKKLNQSK